MARLPIAPFPNFPHNPFDFIALSYVDRRKTNLDFVFRKPLFGIGSNFKEAFNQKNLAIARIGLQIFRY